MPAPHDQPCAPLLRCARGELPANIALVHLFMQAQDDDEAGRLLDQAIGHFEVHDAGDGAIRLQRMRELWESCPQSFAMIKAMLQIADGNTSSGNAPDPVFWTSVFDRAAVLSPEAGVALYSLGQPEILRQATAEIVERMRAWQLLAPGCALLDIGCGSGRILRAAAPHVGVAIGVDVSPLMLQAARRHAAGCGNITVLRTSGRDLAVFADAQFDLVCAVDAFPYLVMSGLAEIHLQEAARVLRPDGKLLVLNYSYGGDAEADRSEIMRAAARFGLTVRRNGTRDYSLWDGLSFLLEKKK
jgi:ubiquinone/menaquinone biosynthesis C-methylase UbiE